MDLTPYQDALNKAPSIIDALNAQLGVMTLPTIILVGVFFVAKLVVIATPTPRDDEWYGKVYKVIEWAALVVGKAKLPPSNKI